jgi:hypothetical protein
MDPPLSCLRFDRRLRRSLYVAKGEVPQREETRHAEQERQKAFLSNDMDQEEADGKHHRAGYAMNRERRRLRPARPQNV